ncbi:MAG: peptidoglycan DD-metalloendopeptidase family protein [Parvibaculaceae bacterium]
MSVFRRSLIAFVFALAGAAALEWADYAHALERIGLTRAQVADNHDVNLGDCLLGRTDPNWPASYRTICADLAQGGDGPPDINVEVSASEPRADTPVPIEKILPPQKTEKPKPASLKLASAPIEEKPTPPPAKPACLIDERGTTTLQKTGSPRIVPPQLAKLKSNGTPQPGVALVVNVACTVASPVDGKVVYAGDFKGYRGVVIIRMTSGQQLIIAGLDRIDVKRTARITRGLPLGVTSSGLAPALASAYGQMQNGQEPDTTLLYFDLRNAKGIGEKVDWLQQLG